MNVGNIYTLLQRLQNDAEVCGLIASQSDQDRARNLAAKLSVFLSAAADVERIHAGQRKYISIKLYDGANQEIKSENTKEERFETIAQLRDELQKLQSQVDAPNLMIQAKDRRQAKRIAAEMDALLALIAPPAASGNIATTARDIADISMVYADELIPKDITALASDIEKTQDVLESVSRRFLVGSKVFFDYMEQLTGAAEVGLTGYNPQPQDGAETLQNLQTSFLANFKGFVIAAHVRDLFISIFALMGLAEAAAIAFALIRGGRRASLWDFFVDNPLLALVPGLALGVLLAAILRCQGIGFYQLSAVDNDKFTPNLRVSYAMELTGVTAVFLKAKFFDVTLGEFKLSSFDTSLLAAFCLGVICGLAQDAVVAAVTAAMGKLQPKK